MRAFVEGMQRREKEVNEKNERIALRLVGVQPDSFGTSTGLDSLNPEQREEEFERLRANVRQIEEQQTEAFDERGHGRRGPGPARQRREYADQERRRIEIERELAQAKAYPFPVEEKAKKLAEEDVLQSVHETLKELESYDGGRKKSRKKKRKSRKKKRKSRKTKKKKKTKRTR